MISAGLTPTGILTYTVDVLAPRGWQGSGTVIGHVGYDISDAASRHSLILTCWHVVTGDGAMAVPKTVGVDKDGQVYEATVLFADKRSDLAVLDVTADWPAAPIYSGTLDAGESEIVAGFPLGEGKSLTQGYISAATQLYAGHTIQQGSADVFPGNSGGGVWINRDGWKLAGVAESTRMFHHGELAPAVSFFIPAWDAVVVLRNFHL